MARLNVNPTRMELTRLKKRLVTASRGHKLLKDKRDELMKQFLDIVRISEKLRLSVEKALMESYAGFQAAGAVMSPEMLEQTFLYPKQGVGIEMTFRNIMSVNVPMYDIITKTDDKADIYPYGFAATSGELDDAVSQLSSVLTEMLKLAEHFRHLFPQDDTSRQETECDCRLRFHSCTELCSCTTHVLWL